MNKDLIKVYGVDASRIKGLPLDVVFPRTIDEVRKVSSEFEIRTLDILQSVS